MRRNVRTIRFLFFFVYQSKRKTSRCCSIHYSFSINARYTLYYSDIVENSFPAFDCLFDDGKVPGKPYIRNSHLIPYCRRPDYDNDEQNEIFSPINENKGKRIHFKELKKQSITSEQLLEWFAPIDIAEKSE
jgi:hypothetical protein